MVMDGREKDMIEQAKLIRESGGKKEANLNLFNAFGDFIVDVACSIAYNNADRYLVIVENKGCIPQMPYDAWWKFPATCASGARSLLPSAISPSSSWA